MIRIICGLLNREPSVLRSAMSSQFRFAAATIDSFIKPGMR